MKAFPRRTGVLLYAALLSVAAGCTDELTSPALPLAAPLADVGPAALVAGVPVFGTSDYVEYIPGTLPVIISAPHGGELQPEELPRRVEGEACGSDIVVVRDANTQELARTIGDAFFARTGQYPHIVINRLHRNRLDPNRGAREAACGDPAAELAWNEYHAFIDAAKAAVLAQHGKGWYTDVHGHGHAVQRLELGYELTGTTLRRPDTQLDATTTHERSSSIRMFSEASPLSFSALLRGPTSLGTLLANAGYPSTPSAQDPAPQVGEGYFSGGYSTDRHACSRGGQICGVQIETNFTGVRDNGQTRSDFAIALVDVYREFLRQFGIALPFASDPDLGGGLIVDNDNAFNDPRWARFEASSSWSRGTNAQTWGTSFQLGSASASAPNDGAEFHFNIPAPGTYAVDAWWPALSSRSSSVLYRLYEYDGASGMADVRVNQRTAGARWNPLGTYKFGRAGWTRVLVSRSLSTTGSLAADAIRVTQLNAAPSLALAAGPAILQGEAFTARGTITDTDDESWTVSADFGDGSAPVSFPGGRSFDVTHEYHAAGEFTLSVRVADDMDETTATVRATVVTPLAAARQLLADVNALGATDRIAAGRLTGLRAPLEAAIRQLERGNTQAAAGQLGAFGNQSAALVNAGVLTAEEAEVLRGMAERIARSAARFVG